ncbi:MAG: hypothetical protein AVDCRST_MAG86-2047, partial [uncultured Truepera sp.]
AHCRRLDGRTQVFVQGPEHAVETGLHTEL